MTDKIDYNQTLLIDGQEVSLAQLAGIELDTIAEQRGGGLPMGLYDFEVLGGDDEPALKLIETGAGTTLVKKVALVFPCKVINVHGLKNNADAPNGNPAELIGKKHQESFFDPFRDEVSLGYVKSFLKDIGALLAKQSIRAMWEASPGLRFTSPISHRVDKYDTDKVYTQFARGKIKALPRAATSDLAGVASA